MDFMLRDIVAFFWMSHHSLGQKLCTASTGDTIPYTKSTWESQRMLCLRVFGGAKSGLVV